MARPQDVSTQEHSSASSIWYESLFLHSLDGVILEPRVAIPYGFEPIDSVDMPVTLAAAGARPPQSLLELVRRRGQPHPELEAWFRGESFELVEPPDALLADDVRNS